MNGKGSAPRRAVNYEAYCQNYPFTTRGEKLKQEEIANAGALIGYPWLAVESDGSMILCEHQPRICRCDDSEDLYWQVFKGENESVLTQKV